MWSITVGNWLNCKHISKGIGCITTKTRLVWYPEFQKSTRQRLQVTISYNCTWPERSIWYTDGQNTPEDWVCWICNSHQQHKWDISWLGWITRSPTKVSSHLQAEPRSFRVVLSGHPFCWRFQVSTIIQPPNNLLQLTNVFSWGAILKEGKVL